MSKNIVRKTGIVAALLGMSVIGTVVQAEAMHSTMVAKSYVGDKGTVKPKAVYFTVDGAHALRKVHWKTWGKKSAKGTALEYWNGCVPNCAQTHLSSLEQVTVTLVKPVGGFYTKAVIKAGARTNTYNLPK